MKARLAAAALAAVFIAALTAVAVAAPSGHPHTWTGRVVHVSRENIKVENGSGTQSLSFLLSPGFKHVYTADGKIRLSLSQVKPGMKVRVDYDQRLFGARHADAIYVLDSHARH